MATITITDLEVSFHVGVPDAERARPQRLLITIEMQTDVSHAAATDDIRHTIDYYKVCHRVANLGEGRSWKLIEKLASDVADEILNYFKPAQVTVTIKKFVLPQTAHVAVMLTKPPRGVAKS